MARGNKYEIDMVSGAIFPKLMRFALPLMLSSMLQLLFNAADVVVVGRFAGDTALAAVGSTGSLTSLIVNLFIGLSVGTNVIASRAYGSGDVRTMQLVVSTSMILSAVGGFVLSIIGVAGARTFLEMMSMPDEVLGQAATYLRIYFAGMTFSMIYNFGSAILRSVGDTRRPLYFLILAGVVNVVLNLIFVIVFGMGVAGVAWATIISQAISAVLVVICLIRSESSFRLSIHFLKFDMKVMRDIAKIGLPAGLQSIMFSISNVLIQSSINAFGATAIAGNSAASNIEGFMGVSMNAYYQAAISFTGQNMGAGKPERVWKIFRVNILCMIVTGLIMGWGVLLLGRYVLGIYTESADVIEAGLIRMRVMCPLYFTCGLMDTMVGFLRGLGKSFMPMVVTIFGVCVFRVLWISFVCPLPQFADNIGAIYISYPISWSFTGIIHLITFLATMKKLKEVRHD